MKLALEALEDPIAFAKGHAAKAALRHAIEQAANELRRLSEMERALEMQDKALRSLEAQNTELDKKLAELEAEAQEDARIIGMSAERELALRAEIDRLKKAVTATAWAYGNLK
jgi:septal ring factor EnvC (AmiA/AmiB activator)